MDPLEASVSVDVPPEHAFEVFTEGMTQWWPREFSWSQEGLEEMGIEPREGGFAYERGPHGFTIHWGRVITFEVPQRVVFTWQIASDRSPQPDPDQASEVEVLFTGALDGGTDVTLEHRGWERHGEGAKEYRDGFETAGAWPHALARFAAATGTCSARS
jgi:uncharacterized protein YndB with AHSA1/START domain